MKKTKKCACNPRLGYKVCRSGNRFVHHKTQKCRSASKKSRGMPSMPKMPEMPKMTE